MIVYFTAQTGVGERFFFYPSLLYNCCVQKYNYFKLIEHHNTDSQKKQEEFLTICEDFLTFLKNPYPNIFGFAIIHCGKPPALCGEIRTEFELEIVSGEEI